MHETIHKLLSRFQRLLDDLRLDDPRIGQVIADYENELASAYGRGAAAFWRRKAEFFVGNERKFRRSRRPAS
jgi:hypothetical protein